MGRVGHDGELERPCGDPSQRVQPHEARAQHDARKLQRRHPFQALLEGIQRAGDVGKVGRAPSGGRVGFRDRVGDHRGPFVERGGALAGQPMVVLDHIHACPGEGGREPGESAGGQPDRFDCRAHQRPPRGPGQRTEAADAEARPGQRLEDGGRQRETHQPHAVHKRNIAVRDVQDLCQFGRGRCERIGDARDPSAPGHRLDALDLSQHPRLKLVPAHAGRRFHRLLARDGAGEGHGLSLASAAQTIGGHQANGFRGRRLHGHCYFSHRSNHASSRWYMSTRFIGLRKPCGSPG